MKALFAVGLSLLVFLSAQAGAEAAKQQFNFDVFLGDKAIGYHRFDIARDLDATQVVSEAEFSVKLLFFDAFSYAHETREIWSGQCLSAVESNTSMNDKQLTLAGMATVEGFAIEAAEMSAQIEGCVRSFAYWDFDLLNSNQLLNVQTGELETVSLQKIGSEMITKGDMQVQADQYRLANDKFTIDLWYSPAKEWLALESKTRLGSRLRYVAQ